MCESYDNESNRQPVNNNSNSVEIDVLFTIFTYMQIPQVIRIDLMCRSHISTYWLDWIEYTHIKEFDEAKNGLHCVWKLVVDIHSHSRSPHRKTSDQMTQIDTKSQ